MNDITERLRQVCETGCDPDLPYEAAGEIDRLRARIAELQSQPADQYTAELVEIDGHTYGLRPGAARVVKEAMRYRNALAWIATVAATEHDYQELALRVLGETDHMKLIQWRNAAIDAAMAKDGAP